jgi:hypothetical protein
MTIEKVVKPQRDRQWPGDSGPSIRPDNLINCMHRQIELFSKQTEAINNGKCSGNTREWCQVDQLQ